MDRRDEAPAAPPDDDARFSAARLLFIGAALAIAVGLAVAGSVERTAGGALLLAGWALAVVGLHRLGRAGSRPRA